MITAEQVRRVVEEKISDSDLFLVELHVHPGNRIEVFLDSDFGMTIDSCVGVHRHIEKNFDREVEDYELSVSSPGVGAPLRVKRQYTKNVGRLVKVKASGGEKTEGVLKAAGEESIVVQTRTREEVPGKKGKKWVEKEVEIPYSGITEAKIEINFK